MALADFPSPATNGQVYTVNGVTYTYDGTKWTANGADVFVKKAGDTMTGDLTVPSLNGGQLAGMRNVLINGDLRINQRGVTIAAAAVGQYGPDRWKKVDATNMTQIVEDVNFVPGATYTLSWKGGTPQQLTAPASGHWTLPNIPITATEVQLELGTVATPFERRSLGVELLLAQRYYERVEMITGCTFSTTGAYLAADFRATKMTIPNAHIFATQPVVISVLGTGPKSGTIATQTVSATSFSFVVTSIDPTAMAIGLPCEFFDLAVAYAEL